MSKDKLTVAKNLSLQGDFLSSEKILLELIASQDPSLQYPATFNMAWHDMRRGNLLDGFIKLYTGRMLKVYGMEPLKTDKPIYQGGRLDDKKILLRGEGGFGDMFINFRFAKNLKELGAHVTVSCDPSMFTLLRTVSSIDCLISTDFAEGADFDCWLPAMSAVQALKLEYADLDGSAYIPKPIPVPLSGGLKVGIRWAGNPAFEEELIRKIPTEDLCALSNIPGVQLYSLQEGADRVALPSDIVDLGDMLVDWAATARLIASLDVVVTSCTSVAHLAAAMGVETWVITPLLPYYIWAVPGNKSAWYDSVTIFRQEEQGDWAIPLRGVRRALEKAVDLLPQ